MARAIATAAPANSMLCIGFGLISISMDSGLPGSARHGERCAWTVASRPNAGFRHLRLLLCDER
jgi:hypothetical protein